MKHDKRIINRINWISVCENKGLKYIKIQCMKKKNVIHTANCAYDQIGYSDSNEEDKCWYKYELNHIKKTR